jgi:hypothetical protein
MEEDMLRAEVYGFLAKLNNRSFNPSSQHVNKVIDAVKAWAILPGEVDVGWLGRSRHLGVVGWLFVVATGCCS